MRCVVCNSRNIDRHHVKTRGSGGSDDVWNIASLCRAHHQEFHSIGLNTFTEKYLQFKNWLLANGWEFCEVNKKWRHYE